jgi:CHAT domain-containing protein
MKPAQQKRAAATSFAVLGACLFALFAAQVYFYASAGQMDGDFTATLTAGTRQLQAGQFHLALDTLQAAVRVAPTAADSAVASGWLGVTHYRMRHLNAAEDLLRKAINGDPSAADQARWLTALADVRASLGARDEALDLYRQARVKARGDLEADAAVRLAQARLLGATARIDALQALAGDLDSISRGPSRARLLLNLGAQASTLGEPGQRLAYESFAKARRIGVASPRLNAEALAGLAGLYEDQRRLRESLQLNGEARQQAERAEAGDLLMELEWREGRLLRALNQPREALAAYRLARQQLELLRPDIPVEYHDGRSSFRETLGPIYLELADLLLQQAGMVAPPNVALLHEARDTVELIKRSEMEDYLGGRCALPRPKRTPIETLDARTAVLYPIIFPERLDTLVAVGDQLKRYSHAVSADTLQASAVRFSAALREQAPDANQLARQWYAWLLESVDPWLRSLNVDTLVMVPDGAIRLIPLAALFDGQHYVLEHYATATSPGLSLLESDASGAPNGQTLIAGMSTAGPVVENLPPVFFRALAAQSRKNWDDADELGAKEFESWAQDPDFRASVAERMVLPGVEREVHELEQTLPHKLLSNDAFTRSRFEQEIGSGEYSVVHIASHGVLGHSADVGFIMASDAVLDVNDFERIFSSARLRRRPVDLLTLSACQTAVGDDRAPLGLSGIALKSRVRSALGSLWPVSDHATADLMTAFYRALYQPGTSKVQALRRAQLTILRDTRFSHPFFWAPFILVGNWL